MDVIRLGENAVILKAANTPYVLSKLVFWKNQILGLNLVGIEDIVPSYQTLTIFYDPASLSYEKLVQEVKDCLLEEEDTTLVKHDFCSRLRKIPVCYDLEMAPDIVRVAEFCRLKVSDVVALHSEAEYQVAGIGFSPGFGFLSGLPDALYCPRREIPRKEVPAGSVGVAALQTGVYPDKTSGGWNLIGRTPKKMTNYDSAAKNELEVGDIVKFYPITKEEFDSFD